MMPLHYTHDQLIKVAKLEKGDLIELINAAGRKTGWALGINWPSSGC
ncbi:MAG: hypothetical protein A4E62_00176 [Syntrophorhabdus sp. PtaU1.Bin002]|nr:MAG: hypothetical protein A4E62_00176 [Syntrophorhabdus sp. PtaU1.Bin002]